MVEPYSAHALPLELRRSWRLGPAESGRSAPASSRADARTWAREERWPLVALLVLLALGGALRLWLLGAWRPAILGFPDEQAYLAVASSGGGPAADPIHAIGYPLFLELLHGLGANPSVTILVQHLLGMAAAVLLFATVRRVGVSAWAALVAPLVVLLAGTQIFLEHTVLSEPLFTFLAIAALYCTMRADTGPWPWAALAGLLIAMATTVRPAGLPLVPLVVLWLLVRRPGVRARWVPGLAAAVTSLTMLLSYASWHDASAGGFGFTSNGSYNLYGRVATWADCKKFTPPQGTRVLCDPRPPDERPGAGVFLYNGAAPAVRAFGAPTVALVPGGADKLRAFALAAIEHQPLTYIGTTIQKLLRTVDPGVGRSGEGNTPDNFLPYVFDPGREGQAIGLVRAYYATPALLKGSTIGDLQAYESRTHVDGLFMALLIALAIAAPFAVSRSGPRGRAVLLTLFAFDMLLTPLATVDYDYRYVIPATGPLAAAAGVGAWGLWRAWCARRPAVATPDRAR